MFQWIKNIYERFILKNNPLPNAEWQRITKKLALLNSLSRKEKKALKKLVILFLHEKTITGVQGLEVTQEIKITIAAQACLAILKLDLDYYDGWVEIVVYPAAFIVNRNQVDESGLVSEGKNSLSGEAWQRGPVILSWHDVLKDSYHLTPGHNIIIHEFSHKLDMLNGRANGMPPLHPSMHRSEWTKSLSDAYGKLVHQVDHQSPSYINQYAATNPAEFFAVTSEYFFTAPDILLTHCPEVYAQLALFYKQKPIG